MKAGEWKGGCRVLMWFGQFLDNSISVLLFVYLYSMLVLYVCADHFEPLQVP